MLAARDFPLGLIMTPTVPLRPLATAVVRVRRPRAAAWMREAASARESLKSAENHIILLLQATRAGVSVKTLRQLLILHQIIVDEVFVVRPDARAVPSLAWATALVGARAA